VARPARFLLACRAGGWQRRLAQGGETVKRLARAGRG